MQRATLVSLLRERGALTDLSGDPLRNRTIYSVRVHLDPLMRAGEIRLEKR